jgi:hypothetical protein
MDAEDKRAIIWSIVEHIEVLPSDAHGRTSCDMSRLNFVWRYEGIGKILTAMHENGEQWRWFPVWTTKVAPS